MKKSPQRSITMHTITSFVVLVIILIIIEEQCNAFAVDSIIMANRRCALSLLSSSSSLFLNRNHSNNNVDFNVVDRRNILKNTIKTTFSLSTIIELSPNLAIAENETMERGGIKLTPFNSLAFNYREGESPTIEAKTLNNEPSITYTDFLSRLDAGTVTYVEFFAPYGNVAYATFITTEENNDKNSSSTRKRIGEGYPIEDPAGWSSPAFVIKAVAKKGVPYKFIVPGIGG